MQLKNLTSGFSANLKYASQYFDFLQNKARQTTPATNDYSIGYLLNEKVYYYNRSLLCKGFLNHPYWNVGCVLTDSSIINYNLIWGSGNVATSSIDFYSPQANEKIYATVNYDSAYNFMNNKLHAYYVHQAFGHYAGSLISRQFVLPIENDTQPYTIKEGTDLKQNLDFLNGIVVTGITLFIGNVNAGEYTNISTIITGSNIYEPYRHYLNKRTTPYLNQSGVGMISLETPNNISRCAMHSAISHIMVKDPIGEPFRSVRGSNGLSPVKPFIYTNEDLAFNPTLSPFSERLTGETSETKYALLVTTTPTIGMWCKDIKTLKEYYQDWGVEIVDDISVIPPSDILPSPDGIQINPSPEIPAIPDDSTDIINIEAPNITPLDYVTARFYNTAEANKILNWLTTANFIDEIKPLYASPSEAILGARLYNIDFVAHDGAHVNNINEFSVVNVSTEANGYSLRLGYNNIFIGGELSYTAYYGDYNDFVNMSYHLYIPYVGIIKLDSGDVVNKHLKLLYAADLVGDNSTYYLLSNDNIIKMGKCSLGSNIPITSSNYNQALTTGILGILSGIGNMSLLQTAGAILNTNVTYNTTGTTGNLSTTRFIPPYLIVDKFPPQLPETKNLLCGNPATFSDTIKNLSKKSVFVNGTVIKGCVSGTAVENEMIARLIQDGIYL